MINNLALLLTVLTCHQLPAQQEWIDQKLPGLVTLYEQLHQSPELSFQEKETSKKMAAILRENGFVVIENIGGYGVAGVLRNGEGPSVLVRADTDALPIVENTGLEYSSKVRAIEQDGHEVGVMHACGHDVHMTVWSGVASFLAQNKSQWSGTLLFVAQPAEERGAGSAAMLADGLYEKTVTPDFALALHVTGMMPVGDVGLCEGYALANVDSVNITVRGKGGHGSTPEVTHDPIALAARIVMGLQTIVSREISPFNPAVVTVGSIHGGSKHNIISDRVDLQLTVRSYESTVREKVLAAIKRCAINEGRAAGFPEDLLPIVELLDEHTPAAYNDPEFTKRMASAMKSMLGESRVHEAPPVMGGEDFGRFGPAADCPSSIFWLGVSSKEMYQESILNGTALPNIHSDKFAPSPSGAIRTGVLAMTAAVLDLLPVK
jgi:hippurate hydrolase